MEKEYNGLPDVEAIGEGVATKRAQRYYGELGVHLEGERVWRSGGGKGETGGKGLQTT